MSLAHPPELAVCAQGRSLQIDPLVKTSENILRHPHFKGAVIHYAAGLARWNNGPRLVNKLSSTHTRSQIVGYINYLHFQAESFDDGPTFQRILTLVETRKDCSRTVLRTVLTLMRLAGFVSLLPGKKDKRLGIYVPTPKLIRFMQDWYSHTLGCFDIMTNSTVFSVRIKSDMSFFKHFFVSISVPYIEQNIQLVAKYPDIFEIFSMDSGFVTAAILVEERLADKTLSTPAEIAKAYRRPVSQIRNVFKVMQNLGLVDLSTGGQIANCDKLARRFELHVARELALYAKYALGLDAFFDGYSRSPLSMEQAETDIKPKSNSSHDN